MLVDQLAANAHIRQAQAWQAGHVLAFVVHTRCHEVNNLHLPRLKCLSLEQLLLAGTHRARLKLALNNLQALVNLLLIDASAIAPEHELDNVGGYRKLPTEGTHQVFPDQIPVQHRGGLFVYLIQFNHSSSSDHSVCLCHQLARGAEQNQKYRAALQFFVLNNYRCGAVVFERLHAHDHAGCWVSCLRPYVQ